MCGVGGAGGRTPRRPVFADKWDCHNDLLRAMFSDGRIHKAVHGLKALWRTLLAEGITP